jgi:amino acid transporter
MYVTLQAISIGTVPNLATSSRPLADAGSYLMGTPGAALISLGALISVAGTMNAIMLAGPRLLFAMAEQGQLPRIVSTAHQRFRTPHVAILFSAAVILVLTLTGTFISLVTLSTVIRLVTYASTCAALQVFRRRDRNDAGVFILPGGKVISTLSILLIVWLFSSSAWSEAVQTLAAAAVGLMLYALCAGRQRQARYEVV